MSGDLPRLVLVHHRAEATPETVAFVELVRSLVDGGRVAPEVVLFEGGPLAAELEGLALTTVVADLDTRSGDALVETLLFKARLRDAGYRRRSRRLGLDRWAPGDAVYLHSVLAVQVLRYLPPDRPLVLCRLAEDVYPLRHPLRAPDVALLLRRVDHLLAVTDAGVTVLLEEHGLASERVHRVPEVFAPARGRLPDRRAEIEARRDELGIADDALVVGSFGAYEADAPDLGVLLWAMLTRRRRGGRPVEMLWWYQDTGAGFWMTHDLSATGLAPGTHPVSTDQDPGPYLELCDVLVLLTREPDAPFAYLERAAQGTPILCFDINEMAPLAAEGDPRHVAPYLDLAALADELARLLDAETLTEDRDAMLAAVARAHGPAAFADLLVDLVRSRGDG